MLPPSSSPGKQPRAALFCSPDSGASKPTENSFLGLSPTHWSQSRECLGLHCSLERDKDLERPKMGRKAGLKTLHSWGVGYEEPLGRIQNVKAAWEVSVKGQKWLLWQHSCLLSSFQSSQLDFGMETSAQTHPSPRHRQWVKGHRSDPVTHPMETHLTTGSTQVCSSPRLHRQSPAPTASWPPKLEAHTAKALRTSCQCHTPSSLLQVVLPSSNLQWSMGCL